MFKKITTKLGYRLINSWSEVEIPVDTGDFRLMNRRVIEELKKLKEHNGFLKGLVPFVGFRQTLVRYNRDARSFGKGNYNRFTGNLRLQLNGIFCFSSKPLQIMSYCGFFAAAIGFILGLAYFIAKVVYKVDFTPGLSTTVVLVTFFSGIQLFCMGVLGEYISRIYDEVKQRPMYIIDEFDKNDD